MTCSPKNFDYVTALCAHGAVRPPETEVLPLAKVADTHRMIEAGHVRGKVVLAAHTD